MGHHTPELLHRVCAIPSVSRAKIKQLEEENTSLEHAFHPTTSTLRLHPPSHVFNYLQGRHILGVYSTILKLPRQTPTAS